MHSRCLSPGSRAIVSHPLTEAESAHALPRVPFPRYQGRVAELRPAWLPLGCAISACPCPEGGAPRRPVRAARGAIAGRAAGPPSTRLGS